MDNLDIAIQVLNSVALCCFGFQGVAAALTLQAALTANAYFWRERCHHSMNTPHSPIPSLAALEDPNNAYPHTIELSGLSQGWLEYSIDQIKQHPTKAKISLCGSEINKELLQSLLQKLIPHSENPPQLLLDLRRCHRLSIHDIAEVLRQHPSLHMVLSAPFTSENIYWLQTECPLSPIDFDTRYEDLLSLFEKGIDTDITFIVKGKEIKAHRFIFAAFENANVNNLQPGEKVVIDEMDPIKFTASLRVVYLSAWSCSRFSLSPSPRASSGW
jgi:hypothetical protein